MRLKKTPELSVGISTANEVLFELHGLYSCKGKNYEDVCGKASVVSGELHIFLNGEQLEDTESVLFHSGSESSFLEIKDVVIGVDFHWERKENQQFKGDLKLIVESVIASEMSATASKALLKAHAVISRSWLLAQVIKKKEIEESYQSIFETETELIKWYDREDHTDFDVCADDHCQRYQGITRIGTQEAIEAVRETQGEVLLYGDEVCDARFSKCCGGVVESFENVWEPKQKPYLVPLYDAENESLEALDLTKENEAVTFITSSPKAFCNTKDVEILVEVLNDYDQETQDFYRWEVRYSQKELSELVKKRSGIDYGKITDLIPVERGHSGRLTKLKIVGEKRTRTIGKELEIRKTLSESHLYSAAFVVKREGTDFILKGAGWGHGVGLCQIGAAAMGARGYDYAAILHHYFKNISLERIY